MAVDNLTEVASGALRGDLKILEEGTRLSEKFTPISEITDDMFEPGQVMSWFTKASAEKQAPLKPDLIEMSRLCLQAYAEQREENPTGPKIVGQISVSPAGPEGRWLVNFTSTQIEGDNDLAARSSTFLFDIAPTNLDELSPARTKHLVVGRRKGEVKMEIIGTWQDLWGASLGKLSEGLQAQGLSDIGEIWAADTDHHTGFFQATKSFSK